MKQRWLFAVLLCVASGCGTSGNPVIADSATVSQIQIGKSTKQDVRQLLGEPNNVMSMQGPDGIMIETWSYGYSNIETSPVTFIPIVGLFAGKSTVQSARFGVTFNDAGVVTAINRMQNRAEGGPGASR